MTDKINRRNFLFGTVAGSVAAGALTLVGEPRALKLFEPTFEEIVSISRVPITPQRVEEIYRSPSFDPCGPGDTLFNAQGRPVAIVSNMIFMRDKIDVTTYQDYMKGERVYHPGLMHVNMEVEYIGGPITQRSNS